MNIVVTGARGYIGTPLCAELRQRGHALTEFDLDLYTSDPKPRDSKYQRTVLDACAEADAVVWLAALAHDPLGRIQPAIIQAVNTREPLEIAQFLSAAGGRTRFIVPSSLSVFSDSPYARSKWYLENNLSVLPNFFKFVNIVRFGTVCGFYEAPSFRAHLLINSMVLGGFLDGRIMVRGAGLHRPVLTLRTAVFTLADLAEAPQIERGQIQTVYEASASLEQFARFVQARLTHAGIETERIHSEAVDNRDYGTDQEWLSLPLLTMVNELIEALRKPGLAQEIDEATKNRLKVYYQNIDQL